MRFAAFVRRSAAAAVVVASFAAPGPAHAQTCPPFSDVPAADPFCANIQWMFNRGVTLGCAASLYCPATFVRRDQMAAFMNRLANVTHQQGGNAFGAAAVIGTTDEQAVDVHAHGKRVVRYEPNAISPNVIGGSAANHVTAGVRGATIAGGGSEGADPNLFLGSPNRVTDLYGVIGGGSDNQAGNDDLDIADSSHATVAGGLGNMAWDKWSTVGGGAANRATGNGSTVGGGANNIASGAYSTVSGGHLNLASGVYSWAGGFAAKTQSAGTGLVAIHDGVFIWSDRSVGPFHSAASNEFAVRSTGGVRIVTAISPAAVPVAGVTLTAGDSSWNVLSDRALKDNWRTVDGGEVLERVVAMPIGRWNYRAQSPAVEHIGPSAQDFHAAFGVGHDATRIATVDADGVALAAIQGLNAKVAAQAREIAELRRAVASLLARKPAEEPLAASP